MAELATIARPYAEALFTAASAGGAEQLERTAGWLDTLASIASHRQLLQFADNPKVADAQVFDVVTGIATLPDDGRNFLRVLIENDRLAALPEIASQFRARKNALGGVSDATVYSAFPIEGAALADLEATLEKRFGRRLNLTVQQEPELIGGIRVVVGDEVLDTSVRARLEQMKAALTA
ncbi:MAG TPA: F0F1 ATP synthase subunit delta [Ramlibacter sp.]|uniref:F0F1 ATP synthase subunit delta n=1 Tax=Ramlibacter sp. TaxID=1917967 RepID=UPI002CBC3388|nr:F0F1 ATP synthase subunit delta [Ramlibacter sp.]HVZ46794.1 F0F1 ATP synthase subunit delta [Ramlibacter sp.]